MYIHTLRAVVEVINHSEQYDKENRTYTYYIRPYCFTDDEISAATGFLKHHSFAGRNGSQSHSGKGIHNKVHPQHLCNGKRKLGTEESAQQYNDAGRPELAENELAEAACMEVYLPKQLSEAEVEAKLAEIIAEVGASQPSDMGKVMGVATKRLAGLAEGRMISALVKKLLSK